MKLQIVHNDNNTTIHKYDIATFLTTSNNPRKYYISSCISLATNVSTVL